MFISDGFLVIPLFLIIVMLAMLIRDKMNIFSNGPAFGRFWLGLGRAGDPLPGVEPA